MAKGKEKLDPGFGDDTDDRTVFDDDATLTTEDFDKKHTVLDTISQDGTTLLDGEEGPRRVMYMNGEFEGSAASFSQGSEEHTNELMEAQMSQIQYNNNKIALNRAINTSIHYIEDLQAQNKTPGGLRYPVGDSRDEGLDDIRSLRALQRRNTVESILESKAGESKKAKNDGSNGKNRVSFQVLRLGLKVAGDSNNIVSNLDTSSISNLLDDKLTSSINHLNSLKTRIHDTSSKVFVTGDLNSGKSTFCNALLRREILPVDQQPCTSVFCEVIDYHENEGLEEVHAVPLGLKYKRDDQSTYEIHHLKELDDLVGEYDKFAILKVYVKDNRLIEQSLIHNGVVDINLIDAPGLNLDSYQTTEVFSRQEEIDLVVFVVSAENHFTLSAREFITAAAKERQFIFIVVNKFDSIRNKERCVKSILSQVQGLTPETYKDAKDFVHFVSSDGIEIAPGGGPDGDPDDGPDEGPSGNPRDPNFDHLESCLRKFVLEKRALSKLAPAKNFVLKVLGDLEALSKYNEELQDNEKEQVLKQLDELIPICENQKSRSDEVSKEVNALAEQVTDDIYQFARARISKTIEELDTITSDSLEMKTNIYSFADEVQKLMIKQILASVDVSESYAKKKTIQAVEQIKARGETELNDKEFFAGKVFRQDLMFQRKKHHMIKKINREVSFLDFIDPSYDRFSEFIGVGPGSALRKLGFSNKMSLSLMVLGPSASRVLVTKSIISTISHVPILGNILTSRWFVKIIALGTLGVGVYYLINDMPNAFKRKYAKKLEVQMKDLDYANTNSLRILKECRLVLQYPIQQITTKMESMLAENFNKKQTLMTTLKNSDANINFYKKYTQKCGKQRTIVEKINLESIHQVD